MSESVFDERLAPALHKLRDLRYGENPHQPAVWYGRSVNMPVQVLQGKELSYTNILDLDAALRVVSAHPETPAACIVKHTGPCGVAIAATLKLAYLKARQADEVSAFGGIAGLNRTVCVETAEVIVDTYIECVVAPGFDEAALAVLARKQNLRVVVAEPSILPVLEIRSALGGYLVQMRDEVDEAKQEWGPHREDLRVVTERQPTEREWKALRFAWRVCAFVKSNAVVLTSDYVTICVGGGQPNRVGSAKIATGYLELDPGAFFDKLRNYSFTVGASDAFFPFRDGLDALADAGTLAVVQPGGSQNDKEVIDAANEHNMAMVFTGRRHFRH